MEGIKAMTAIAGIKDEPAAIGTSKETEIKLTNVARATLDGAAAAKELVSKWQTRKGVRNP